MDLCECVCVCVPVAFTAIAMILPLALLLLLLLLPVVAKACACQFQRHSSHPTHYKYVVVVVVFVHYCSKIDVYYTRLLLYQWIMSTGLFYLSAIVVVDSFFSLLTKFNRLSQYDRKIIVNNSILNTRPSSGLCDFFYAIYNICQSANRSNAIFCIVNFLHGFCTQIAACQYLVRGELVFCVVRSKFLF